MNITILGNSLVQRAEFIKHQKAYVYSPAGDMITKTDVERGITHNYTYDNLHRLTGETLTGNVPTGTGAGKILEFEYTDSDHPHAVTEVTMNGQVYNYSYDDNGNMTNGPDFTDITNVASRVIKFNADNMVTRIEHSGNGNVDILYDGNGVRAKKTLSTGGTTYYIDQSFEIINNNPTKYIFAGNLRVAKVDSTSLYYYHKDHLGSSTVITDASGNNIIEQSEYAPFGEQRWQVGSTVSNYKFTDQELDPGSGLYNYDARLYDPIIGRFISADPIVPDMYNPQSLNR